MFLFVCPLQRLPNGVCPPPPFLRHILLEIEGEGEGRGTELASIYTKYTNFPPSQEVKVTDLFFSPVGRIFLEEDERVCCSRILGNTLKGSIEIFSVRGSQLFFRSSATVRFGSPEKAVANIQIPLPAGFPELLNPGENLFIFNILARIHAIAGEKSRESFAILTSSQSVFFITFSQKRGVFSFSKWIDIGNCLGTNAGKIKKVCFDDGAENIYLLANTNKLYGLSLFACRRYLADKRKKISMLYEGSALDVIAGACSFVTVGDTEDFSPEKLFRRATALYACIPKEVQHEVKLKGISSFRNITVFSTPSKDREQPPQVYVLLHTGDEERKFIIVAFGAPGVMRVVDAPFLKDAMHVYSASTSNMFALLGQESAVSFVSFFHDGTNLSRYISKTNLVHVERVLKEYFQEFDSDEIDERLEQEENLGGFQLHP